MKERKAHQAQVQMTGCPRNICHSLDTKKSTKPSFIFYLYVRDCFCIVLFLDLPIQHLFDHDVMYLSLIGHLTKRSVVGRKY